MELEEMSKEELVKLAKKKISELDIAYKGVREKDAKISELEKALKDAEEHTKKSVAVAEMNVHEQYRVMIKEAEALRTRFTMLEEERKRLEQGLMDYDNMVELMQTMNSNNTHALAAALNTFRKQFVEKSEDK